MFAPCPHCHIDYCLEDNREDY